MTAEESETRQPTPLAVRADEGEARWWLGNLAVIKATAADTGGSMSILEVTEPSGEETPPHVHHREDMTFWILDGGTAFEVGELAIQARPGDLVFCPRGTALSWKAGDDGCRYLFILTPGGVERMVMELSEPAPSRTLPPSLEGPPDLERIRALGEAHGIERLG